jgi:hypothetical protein
MLEELGDLKRNWQLEGKRGKVDEIDQKSTHKDDRVEQEHGYEEEPDKESKEEAEGEGQRGSGKHSGGEKKTEQEERRSADLQISVSP